MAKIANMNNIAEKPIIIEFSKANGGPREFKTKEEARAFLIKEYEIWQQVFHGTINGDLTNVFQNPNIDHPHIVNTIANTIKGSDLPYSKSPIGKLIQDIKSDQAPLENGALAALAHFSEWKPRHKDISPQWVIGTIRAYIHEQNLSSSKTDAVNKSIEDELSAGRKALETINGLIVEKEKQYEESLTKSVTGFEGEASISLTGMNETAESLKATDKAYSEQMGLQAASEYWNIRSASHAKYEKIWGGALIFYAILSLAAGFCLANGFWESVINVSEYGPDYKYGHIKALSMSVLLFTFIIWGARIIARSYLSNQHLKTDALERRTMIMTYLALTHKNKISEAERALVLEPIFRPTSDGLVKDDGAPNILASLMSRGGPNQG